MISKEKIHIEWHTTPKKHHRVVVATMTLQSFVEVTVSDNSHNFRMEVEGKLKDAIMTELYGPKDIPIAPMDNPGINGDNNLIH